MFNQPQGKNNVQPVPQGVAGQRQGYGTLPAPTEPNLFNGVADDFSFELNSQTGAFELVDKRAQKPPVPAPNQQPQPVATNGANGQNGQPQPNSTPNTYDAKFLAVENQLKLYQDAMLRMAKAVDTLMQNPQQQQQTQQQEPVKLDIQSDDFATNLINMINGTLDQRFIAFKEEIAPLQQTTQQMQGRMEMADVAFQNKDFQDLYPTIERIKKSDPTGTMTWTQAYNTAKDIHSSFKQDSTIRTDNGNQGQAPTTQPQSVDQNLQQRANALATETGGAPRSIVQAEIPGKGVEDAFNQAVADLYGGRP